MPSSGMLRRVALVIADVSEERIASIIRLTIFGELGTAIAVTSKLKHAAKKYKMKTSKLTRQMFFSQTTNTISIVNSHDSVKPTSAYRSII
jgi:hypothetical protein